jgi:hypothetical protein
MTSPAQVRALFCALYAVNEDTSLTIHLIPTCRREIVLVSIAAPFGPRHRVETSADDPDPLTALRADLAVQLMNRLTRDLTALVPHMASVPALAPLIQVGLMLRLGRAFVRLQRVCAPGAGVGGERGRAVQHAFDDAAADLMAYVGLQGA